MNISLHPNAISSFNQRAEALLPNIVTGPVGELQGLNIPDLYVSHTLNTEDIKHLTRWQRDIDGKAVSRFFVKDRQEIGLEETGYRELRLLAEDIQKRKEFYSVVSIEYLEDTIFEWAINRYRNNINTSFFEYVMPKIQQSIFEKIIIIPIFGLYTSISFPLCKTKIIPMSSELFDAWSDSVTEYPNLDTKGFKESIIRFRSQLQGGAACSIRIEAENRRAQELAMEEAENAIALLRILQPTILHPAAPSYCRPLGKQMVEKVLIFTLNAQSAEPPTWYESNVSRIKRFVIDESEFRQLDNDGLGRLHNLYLQENKTDFQKALLKALFTYSKSSLRHETSDRLIYVFTALDSFLLQDRLESIQQNIAERIAFTISSKAEDRKEIRDVVKAAYGRRSEAVHHNESIHDRELLTKFLTFVFRFFLQLIYDNHKYQNRQQFFDEIERKKFS